MARDERLATIFRRERRAGVELDAQRCRMRTQQGDRLDELVAGMSPAKLRIREVALVAERITEIILAGLGDAVELVVRDLLGQPIAGVFGEVKLLQRRMPVHADDLTNSPRHDLHVAAVELDAADLRVGGRRHADVAGRADVEVQPIVGPDRQIFPPVRLILRQIAVDDGGLRRVVEVVLDPVDLRYLRQLGDVERAVVQGDAIRPIKVLGDDLHLAFAVLLDNRIELVERAVADEDGALVAHTERARIGQSAGVDLGLEARRQFQHRQG